MSRRRRRGSHSCLTKQFHQPPRVSRRRALLVVVEIDEDRAPLAPPPADTARPVAQGLIRIVVPVAPAGPMTADIDVACRHLPRRRRVVMIGQAERYLVIA